MFWREIGREMRIEERRNGGLGARRIRAGFHLGRKRVGINGYVISSDKRGSKIVLTSIPVGRSIPGRHRAPRHVLHSPSPAASNPPPNRFSSRFNIRCRERLPRSTPRRRRTLHHELHKRPLWPPPLELRNGRTVRQRPSAERILRLTARRRSRKPPRHHARVWRRTRVFLPQFRSSKQSTRLEDRCSGLARHGSQQSSAL